MAINNLNSGVGIQPTIVDAKGDLIVATGADAVNRLAVGTANQQLVVDSSTSTGLKWAAPAGLVLLNTTSFSGVASQAITPVFSASFTNYKILIVATASTTANITFRMRSGATDNSGANYSDQYLFAGSTSITAARATGQTSWSVAGFGTGTGNYLILDVVNPFVASPTGMLLNSVSNYLSTGIEWFGRGFGHNQSTSYDGYNLIMSAGTMTGSVSTYGYNI
jgi:hypothetical protein